ncbi:MAG: hypothetical protein DRQ40_04475 [Gammaproteobacteria bacterium]|nr:MAG: hypothetical protein DRQ40_04475 [Gammaproteobacteria bacterium]
MSTDKIDLATSIIKNIIKDEELSLYDFSIVLNNAFHHGDVLPDSSDTVLSMVYEGIACFEAAATHE